jgi:hypothetical protein
MFVRIDAIPPPPFSFDEVVGTGIGMFGCGATEDCGMGTGSPVGKGGGKKPAPGIGPTPIGGIIGGRIIPGGMTNGRG